MTLDKDDISAIVQGVLAGLESGNDQIKVAQAKIILGVGERQLNNLVKTYPELKPAGKGSHFFSRKACIRVANLKNN